MGNVPNAYVGAKKSSTKKKAFSILMSILLVATMFNLSAFAEQAVSTDGAGATEAPVASNEDAATTQAESPAPETNDPPVANEPTGEEVTAPSNEEEVVTEPDGGNNPSDEAPAQSDASEVPVTETPDEEQPATEEKITFAFGEGAFVDIEEKGDVKKQTLTPDPNKNNTAELMYPTTQDIAFIAKASEGFLVKEIKAKAYHTGVETEVAVETNPETKTSTITSDGIDSALVIEIITEKEVVEEEPATEEEPAIEEGTEEGEGVEEENAPVIEEVDKTEAITNFLSLFGGSIVTQSDGALSFSYELPEIADQGYLLTGQTATIDYVVAMSKQEAVVLAIPITAISETSNVVVDATTGFDKGTATFEAGNPYGLAAGTYYIVAIQGNNSESVDITSFTVSYTFPAGTTPDNVVQQLGVMFPGTIGSFGDLIAGSKIVIKPGATAVASDATYTLTSKTNETIGVDTKAFATGTSSMTKPDESLSYKQVELDKAISDPTARTQRHAIGYFITLKTTGDGTYGRIKQQSVTLYDTITGLKSKPKSITVNNRSVDFVYDDATGTATFNFPAALSDGLINDDQYFTVVVDVDKVSYLTEDSTMYSIGNQVYSKAIPENSAIATQDQSGAPVQAPAYELAYVQGALGKATLTVQKQVNIKGTNYNYNSSYQSTYPTVGNPVAFKLESTPDNGTTWNPVGTDVSIDTAYGRASFPNLEAGNYRLTETKGISNLFDDAAPQYFVIEEVNGELIIYSADSTFAKGSALTTTTMVNTYLATESITVLVQQQKAPLAPDTFENLNNATWEVYVESIPGSDTFDALYKAGTTTSTGRITFDAKENVKYQVKVTTSIPGFNEPSPNPITVDTNSTVEGMTGINGLMRYTTDKGSFALTKHFYDYKNVEFAPSTFYITYDVYNKADVTKNADGTLDLTGATAVTTFTLNHGTGTTLSSTGNGKSVNYLFEQGDYYIYERTVTTVTGTSSDQSVSASEFPSGNWVEVKVKADTYDTSVSMENKSTDATVSITNKDTNGNNLSDKSGFTYTFKNKATGASYYIYSTSTSRKLPAGTYEVTTTASTSTSYESSKYAFKSQSVSEITIAPQSENAVVDFVYAMKPTYEFTKTDNAATPKALKGATYTLYKLQTSGSYTGYYANMGTTATSAETTGTFSFELLEPGATYALVESKVPDNYLAPDYRAVFYSGDSLRSYVAKDTVEGSGAHFFTVGAIADENYDNKTAISGGTFQNTPNPKIKVEKLNGKKVPIGGAGFTLYQAVEDESSPGTYTKGTVLKTRIGSGDFDVALKEGYYFVEETLAPVGYQKSDEQILIKVDKYGKISYVSGLGSTGSKTSINDKNSELTVSIVNIGIPEVSIKKTGETDTYNDKGEVVVENLRKVEFKLYDNAGNEVFLKHDDGYYAVVPGATKGDTLVTNGDGNFNIKNLIPELSPYNLVEISYPDNGVTYDLIKDTYLRVVENTTAEGTEYLLEVWKGKPGESGSKQLETAKEEQENGSIKDLNYYILENKINTAQILLTKILLRPLGNDTYTSEVGSGNIIKDPSDPNYGYAADGKVTAQDAHNAVFEVYNEAGYQQYLTNGNSWEGIEPVDTLETSTGGAINNAITKELPVGNYYFVEIQNAVHSVKGDLYRYDEGDQVWKTNTDVSSKVYKFELVSGGGELQKCDIGNLEEKRIVPEPPFVRAYGKKLGISIDHKGKEIKSVTMNGVEYAVYAAYVNNGTYTKLTDNPIYTGITGTVEGEQGTFYTPYFGTADFQSWYSAKVPGGDISDPNLQIGFLLVELGMKAADGTYTLPADYDKKQLGTQTFIACDFTKNEEGDYNTGGSQTNGKPEGNPKVDPEVLKNYAGVGTLQVVKQDDSGTTRSGYMYFEVYNASDLTTPVKDEYGTVIIKSDGTYLYNIPAGEYYLKEVYPNGITASSSTLNDDGTWSVDSTKAEDFIGFTNATEPLLGKNKSEMIGPFAVYDKGKDQNNNAKRVVVTVKNNFKPNFTIYNIADGVKGRYVTSNYLVTYEPSKTGTLDDISADAKTKYLSGEFSNNNYRTLQYLADGTYTIKEASEPATYAINAAASTSPYITVKIEQGKITEITPNDDPNSDGIEVNYTSPYDRTGLIYVDHVKRPALLINMGYIKADGAVTNTGKTANGSTGFGAGSYGITTFSITDEDGNAVSTYGGSLAKNEDGTFTWDAPRDSVYLDFNTTYHVTQTTTDAAGFILDSTTVVVTIGEEDVYLENSETLSDGTTPNSFYNLNSSTFYNKVNLGAYQVYKVGEDDIGFPSSTQTGATFELYDDKGAKVETVYQSYPTQWPSGVIKTNASGIAYFEVAPGTYTLRETTPASDEYSVREDITITVVGNRGADKITSQFTKDVTDKTNAIGIVDPKAAAITVVKTSNFDAGGSGQGSKQTVGGVTFTLYKEVEAGTTDAIEADGKYYLKVASDDSRVIKDDAHGTVVFSKLSAGVYKVVETPSTTVYDNYDLTWLDFSKSDYGALATSPEFTIAYDNNSQEANGSLKVSSTNAAHKDDWSSNESNLGTLEVFNEYNGVSFVVEKLEYDAPNDPIKNEEFTFELWYYDSEADENILLRSTNSTDETPDPVLAKTDEEGKLYFDPISTELFKKVKESNGQSYFYIVETAAPSGYIADGTYDDLTKKVDITKDVNGAYITTFKNKKDTTEGIGVTKTVDPGALQTALVKLGEEGESVTYTLTQNAPENVSKLTNYALTEHLLKFYTDETLTDTSEAINAADAPKYAYSAITVNPSTSRKDIKDSSATAVYAKVIGYDAENTAVELSGWSTEAITVSAASLNGIVSYQVIYSDVEPAQDALSYTVGYDFEPGVVTATVTFYKYEQKVSATELYGNVRNIVNTAVVSAEGIADSQDKAVVTAPDFVDERPTMKIEKTIVDTGDWDESTKVFKPSKNYQYQIVLTNTHDSLAVVDPVILDVLPNDAMTVTQAIVTSLPNGLTEKTVEKNSSNWIWWFEGTLEAGESITIEIDVLTNKIISSDASGHVTNAAYGTSAAPLDYNAKYPYGASFTEDSTATSVVKDKAAALNKDYFNNRDMGMYVIDSVSAKLDRSGFVSYQRSISTTKDSSGDIWVSTIDPQPFTVDGTIKYRMQTANDSMQGENNAIRDLVITENIPYNGYQGSTLLDSFLGKMTFDHESITVYSIKKGELNASDYTITFYNAGGTVVAKDSGEVASFVVKTTPYSNVGGTESGYKLLPGDVLTVEYNMIAPSDAELTELEYRDNVEKKVNSASEHSFAFIKAAGRTEETNVVSAQFYALTQISGKIWYDTDRNGIMDGAEALVDDQNVTVSLYKGDENGTLLDQTTTDTGTYAFTGTKADGSTYQIKPQYQNPDDHKYTVIFTLPSGQQFTQYTSFATSSTDPLTVKSNAHHKASGGVEGSTGVLALYAKKATNLVNAGISDKPTVTYTKGVADALASTVSNMPETNPEAWESNTTYTVADTAYGSAASKVPVRAGYDFIGWKVVDGGVASSSTLPVTGTIYALNNTFTMPYNNVTLEAQWRANFDDFDVTGFEKTYDGLESKIALAGVLGTDTVEFFIDGDETTGTQVSNGWTSAINTTTVTVKVTRANSDGTTSTTTKTADIKIWQVLLTVGTDGHTKVYDKQNLNRGGSVVMTTGRAQGETLTVSPAKPFAYSASTEATAWSQLDLVNGEKGAFRTINQIVDVSKVKNTYDKVLPTRSSTEGLYANSYASNYEIVDGTIGDLEITPLSLFISTNSGSKVYNGVPLTAGGTVRIGNDGAEIAFPYGGSVVTLENGETLWLGTTSSITEPGNTKNVFDKTKAANLDWSQGTAKAINYTVSVDEGTLVVTENADEIVVITKGGVWDYDSTTRYATVLPFDLPDGYTLVTATTSAEQTNVIVNGDGTIGTTAATCDDLVIENASGTTVYDRKNNITKLNVTFVDSTLKINPIPLTITTGSDQKIYDGEALTKTGTIDECITGFVNGETATFAVTGSQAEVGESINTYTLEFDQTAIKTNYTIVEKLGTLKVIENPAVIKVTTIGGVWTYDGTAHKGTVQKITLPKGYTVKTAETNAKVTNVAEGTISATCDDLVIENAHGQVVYDRKQNIKKLNVTFVDGNLKIKPAPLTVKTETGSQVYNGTALTKSGTIDGFVNNETASFKVTGAQTNVGESINGYSLVFNKTAAASNYTVIEKLGTLKVTPAPLFITTNTDQKVYNGSALTAGGSLRESQDGSASNFAYGGTLLTLSNGETIFVGTISSITEPGSIANEYAIDWSKGKAKEGNYYIAGVELGRLTVTQNADEIVVVTTGGTWNYSGRTQVATVQPITVPSGYRVATAVSNASATNVAQGVVTATCDDLVIKNAQGNTVYDRKNGVANLKVTFVDATLQILPIPLTITTESAERAYDGTALTAPGTITGFVNGENASFAATGSQTEVGQSTNTYRLVFDGSAIASNYTITETLGTLTVTTAPTTPTTIIPVPVTWSDDPATSEVVTTVETFEQDIEEVATPFEALFDENDTPLASLAVLCWVHWYILLGIIVAAIYSVGVVVRRRRFTNALKDYETEVLGEEETASAGGFVPPFETQPSDQDA